MTPRPRKRTNRALPPNLYPNNGGRSFTYRHPVTGKRVGMGTDRQEAIRAAKELNQILVPSSDLTQRVLGQTTLKQHIDWFFETVVVEREYAAKTQEMYRVQCNKLIRMAGTQSPDQVGVRDLSKAMEAMTPRTANQFRQVAVAIFAAAQSRGLCETNPAEKTLKRTARKARQRLSLDDYRLIHRNAPPWLANAMDLALVTLQRREEVAHMRFDQIQDGYLYVIQQKTKKYDTGYLRIAMGEALSAIVARCRDDDVSPYLVHRRPQRKVKREGMHWTQLSAPMISREFTRIRDEQGVGADLDPEQRPTFHEIRGLGIKLYRDQGEDPQKLAGHATQQMTSNYDSGHDEIRWVETVADLKLSDDGVK